MRVILNDCGATTGGTFSLTLSGAVNATIVSPSTLVTIVPTPTAPKAPTHVTAVAGNASATVTFKAPASDGGDPINSYTVTATPGGATAKGVTSPITIAGLSNGTSYTFTVRATNPEGTGQASSHPTQSPRVAKHHCTSTGIARHWLASVSPGAFMMLPAPSNSQAGSGRLDSACIGDNGRMGGVQAGFPQRQVPQESPVSGERAPGGRIDPPGGVSGAGPGLAGARDGAGARGAAAAVRSSAGPAGERDERHADLPPGRYFDREESWLRFNQRVLELAEDEAVPLLERVRFLSIFATNLDEFFMVRVAGRMRRMAAGLPVESMTGRAAGGGPDPHPGQSPRAQRPPRRVLSPDRSSPPWASEGIEVLRWKELSAVEQEDLQRLFRERIYPVLTPLAVDPAHPFPYISGLSLSLAVMVADPRHRRHLVRPGEGASAAAPVPHRRRGTGSCRWKT